RPHTESTLHGAVAAGSGRGGIFSRRGRVSEPLVFARRSGKGYEQLHGGNSAFLRDRIANRRLDSWTQLERDARVALVVCCGRAARDCIGNRRLLFSYGLAWRSAVAKSGTTRLDCSDARKAEAARRKVGHCLGRFPFASSAASRRNRVSQLQRFLHFY